MNEQLITVTEYCSIHKIDTTFIDILEESGLVKLVSVRRQRYIPHEALDAIERLINWHYELEVNPQGLEVADRLYRKIIALQAEIDQLRAALKNT